MREELRQVQGSISAHNGGLQQIRAKIIQDSQRYHGTIAAVNARLQIGTTPGNPILVQQFNSAQTDIEKLHEDVGEMNKLATDVAGTSTKAAFLSESSRATRGVAGAVDEDHRQLSVLEDEVDPRATASGPLDRSSWALSRSHRHRAPPKGEVGPSLRTVPPPAPVARPMSTGQHPVLTRARHRRSHGHRRGRTVHEPR